MTNLELLHLRFDGPIPRELVIEAAAADIAASQAKPKGPVKLRVKAWTAAGIVDRMAEVMRAVARSGFPCLRGHLAQAGFSTDEIDRHGENARALAARRVAEDPSFPQPVDISVTGLLAAAAEFDRRRAVARSVA